MLFLVFGELVIRCGLKVSSDRVYLEFIWTLLPILVLVFLGYPSMVMLFMVSPDIRGGFSSRVMGWQWYWVYSKGVVEEASYMGGDYRLLDVDCRLVLPSGVWRKLYISSGDVVHSWALPSFGVKMDAIPGRVNRLDLFCGISGVYYGQCSELCGVGHSYIPVCVEVV